MSLRRRLFIGLLSFLRVLGLSQDYFSYGGGNFSGLNQVIANPAAAADNRLKLDVILLGLDAGFNNSWFAVRREALRYNGGFPATWKNTTPNVPDNFYKNFVFLNSKKDRAGVMEARLLLPSVLYQLDEKNSVAFTWSVRQFFNFDGIGGQLAGLFAKELDFSVTQNNRVQDKNITAVQMSWAEYGFTYARVLKNRNKHFLKAGITPKILQGLESGYVIIKDLDFLFSTKDTSSYFNTRFSYGHSANFSSPAGSNQPVQSFYHYVTQPRLGLDLGIIYEWRPGYRAYLYRPDGKRNAWRRDLNKYKLKFGASLVDIGKIRFDKQGTYYDLDVSVRKDNFLTFTTVKDYAMLDSLLRTDFSAGGETNNFSVLLPTALNTQLDLALNRFIYLNLSSHLGNLYRSNYYRVYNYSALCFAPRIEHYWFDVSLPFTYNTLSARRSNYISTGLNIRLGPLSFGTNNFIPFFKGDVSALNAYVLFKTSIPYRQIKDRDGDGVIDSRDKCPDEPGEITLNGCPDADHDNVTDKEDQCPHQPGLAALKGCPDTDGDGIRDADDLCPGEKGIAALRGCPDRDGDSIPDKLDACPDKKGLKQFKGCPDSDGDGIPDPDDLCPEVKGPLKDKGCPDSDHDQVHDGIDACPELAGVTGNKGCPWPDTDKDGIIDKEDSCVTVKGVRERNGCPEPPKLTTVEKRVLQKAFSSLEFATGRDQIKAVSFPALNALAKLMLTHREEWKIKLSGHTDNNGTEESNLVLSEKRAKAVQAYLVNKGVPAENVLVEWFGQSRPLADNATRQGQQKNRRVEMTMLMKEE